MKFNSILLFFGFLLIGSTLLAQPCSKKASGIVRDLGTNKPLTDVHIYLQEQGKEVVTDSTGKFNFSALCAGKYHISFSHANCDAEKVYLELKRDTQFTIYLDHSYHVLKRLALKGTKNGSSKSELLSEQQLEENLSENLGNVLANLSGVRTLKTGNSVAKPVMNGLYGNRIVLLNNGVAQAGQQWGSDHSPEIDPMSANRIRVIKGVEVLQYPGNGMGGVILIEPRKIARDPHLHGKIRNHYQSNGNGLGLGFQLEQGGKKLAWRVNGNLKQVGDQKSPNYYLTNTGIKEANASIQLEKSWSAKSYTQFYASTYNTEIGILRGSHIGNVTDLQDALIRSEPFFTSSNFSYSIQAPRQEVGHHLVKVNHKYYMNDSFKVILTYAGQWNNRKEFDVRRGGRTTTPSLSLALTNQFAELKVDKQLQKKWKLVAGYQLSFTNNTNDPETGILPLIPDYIESKNSAFLTLEKVFTKSNLEFGLRYDNLAQNVATISKTLPRRIERFNRNFKNVSSAIQWTYPIGNKVEIEHGVGFSQRNPGVNELYSGGLHQGVSGIELGNTNLKTEQLIKGTSAVKFNVSSKWYAELQGYWQAFDNYIYLQPLNTFQLTVRGAFPEFEYNQVNAQIYGLDALVTGEISNSFNLKLKGSFLKGKDLTHNLPLINIPSGIVTADVYYNYPKHIHLKRMELENLKFGFTNSYVLRQNDVLDSQDFLPAPPAYYLLGIQASTDIQWNKVRLHFYTKVSNALNTSYRDYLNRQRYFTDEMGVNVVVGSVLKF